MSSIKGEKKHSSRRRFVKDVAVGSAAVAAAGAMSAWIANAGPLTQGLSRETSDGKTKYGKCFCTLPIRKGTTSQLMNAGADVLNGFPCNVLYAFSFKTGVVGLSNEPHAHDWDEAIYFIGSDPKDFSDLGAEVEFSIGPKGQEEKRVFSVPTAVVVPKGIYHCPIVTLKIDKPYLCMAVQLTSKK